MTVATDVATRYALRCHSCSHGLDYSPVPMRIVGLFRASMVGRVASTHAAEVRRKCGSCKWVNVFHPVRTDWRRVELK